MTVATFTKTGNKSTTAAKLGKTVFGVKTRNNDLLKQAYLAYLANGRENLAVTKTRGLVRGGGKKPWRQKGTGRARFGSTRNPIWRSGGIVFGPTGQENYTHKLSRQSKRLAIRQALSLAAESGKIIIIESFECRDGKVNPTIKLMKKIGVDTNVVLVVSQKDNLVERATRNVENLIVIQAKYLNVYDVLNADHIVICSDSLKIINEWLSGV